MDCVGKNELYFNIAHLFCAYKDMMSAALSSAIPNSLLESTVDDTEQRSYQLPFMLPAVTLPQTSTRFRSAPS